MAVESSFEKGKKGEGWNYPCIGIDEDGIEVVGFSSYGVGVVLANPRFSRKLLEPFGAWKMDAFTPLSPSESITLRNV